MKTRLFFIALLLVSFSAFATPPVDEGKAIFTSRCAACHNVNKTLTGPALAGVHERRSMDWIVKFIKSSQALVKAGDKDAIAVYEKFNKIPMPDHSDLSEDNIKSIVEFIKSESKPVEAIEVKTKLHSSFYPEGCLCFYSLFWCCCFINCSTIACGKNKPLRRGSIILIVGFRFNSLPCFYKAVCFCSLQPVIAEYFFGSGNLFCAKLPDSNQHIFCRKFTCKCKIGSVNNKTRGDYF
jgi:cytochrome c551/c552